MAANVAFVADAEAKCYAKYFTGHGNGARSETGIANARADWSNKVDSVLPWPYSVWGRAYDQSWGCEWARRYKKVGWRNYCYAKARPCNK